MWIGRVTLPDGTLKQVAGKTQAVAKRKLQEVKLTVAQGLPVPGVFVVNDRFPIRQAIDELLLINEGSEQAEWAGRVEYLPL